MFIKVASSVIKSRMKKKFPIEVVYRVTAKCNLKCDYCFFPMKMPEMPTEQAKSAIREFADAGTLIWIFTGGEPLLRQDIGELINYAKDCGIVFTKLLTNGIAFQRRMNELKRIDQLNFSLDGPKEVHEKVRGKGTFDIVMKSIELAKQENFDFTITTVISSENMKNNFAGLHFMKDLALKYDCKINFQPIFKYSFPAKNPDILLVDNENLIQALDLVQQFNKQYHNILFSNETHEIWKKAINGEEVATECQAGRYYCYLSPDGNVTSSLLTMNEGQNGSEIGFLNAFNNLNHIHNYHCQSALCLPEKNALYSLKFGQILRRLPRIFHATFDFNY